MGAPRGTGSPSVLVSYVIPVYRPDPVRLGRCLGSLSRQGIPGGEWEAVLVADGEGEGASLLGSGAPGPFPCRVVVQAHGGVSRARNRGLREARGEYVVFVDCDDLLPDGAASILAGELSATGADFVAGNHTRVYGSRTEPVRRLVGGLLEGPACRGYLEEVFAPGADQGAVWGKAFRASFLRANAIRFNESLSNGEDYEFTVRCALAAGRVALTGEDVYSYVYNGASAVRAYDPDAPRRSLDTVSALSRLLGEGGRGVRGFDAFVLDRLVQLVVNWACHPGAGKGPLARRRDLAALVREPAFAAALSGRGPGAFGGARRALLLLLGARLYSPALLIGCLRQLQMNAYGLNAGGAA